MDDVMTTEVITAGPDASYRELVDLTVGGRISAVPMIDDFGRVLGVVSEADLIRKIEYSDVGAPRIFERKHVRDARQRARGRTAADLMTAPAVVVLSGATIPAVARVLDGAQVRQVPVVDDLGRLVGIVSRRDLLKIHLRSDEQIRADVENDVVRTIMVEHAGSVQVMVERGVVTLVGRVGRRSTAEIAGRLALRIPGVVQVVDALAYDADDSDMLTARKEIGIPKYMIPGR